MATKNDTIEIVESYIKSCKSFLKNDLNADLECVTPKPRLSMSTTTNQDYVTIRPRRQFGLFAAGDTNYSPIKKDNNISLSFAEKTMEVEDSRMNAALMAETSDIKDELPILKKAKEFFEFPESSKKESIMKGLLQIFCFIYFVMSHQKTRSIFKNILKVTFDVVFASILVGVSILLSLVTCGEQFVGANKKAEQQVVALDN